MRKKREKARKTEKVRKTEKTGERKKEEEGRRRVEGRDCVVFDSPRPLLPTPTKVWLHYILVLLCFILLLDSLLKFGVSKTDWVGLIWGLDG